MHQHSSADPAAADIQVCREGDFEIHIASSDDMPAIQQWLPQAFVGTPEPQLFSAVDASSGQLIGAASIRMIAGDGRFLLYVDPDARRRGCGKWLYRACAAAAHNQRARRLIAQEFLPATDWHIRFCESLELTPLQRRTCFQVSAARASEFLQPVADRIERSVHWPSSCRTVPTSDLSPREMADFAAGVLGGFADVLADRISQGEFSHSLSVAALDGDRLIGLLLAEDAEPVQVEVFAVERGPLNGRISAALEHHHFTAVLAAGRARVTLEVDPQMSPDTGRLARLCNGTELESRILFGTTTPPGR